MLSMALDPMERAPVRAYAWWAEVRTPLWKAETAMESADEGSHPLVRRAIVLTLRKAAPTREKEAFLRKMANDKHVWAAASWASVA
jgi:hypothetical protein